jgi:hypothetical protein
LGACGGGGGAVGTGSRAEAADGRGELGAAAFGDGGVGGPAAGTVTGEAELAARLGVAAWLGVAALLAFGDGD